MWHLKGDIFVSGVFHACQTYIICHPARRTSLLLVQVLGSFHWTNVTYDWLRVAFKFIPLDQSPLTSVHQKWAQRALYPKLVPILFRVSEVGYYFYQLVSVAKWSARRTCNPVVPCSSPTLATCWICSWSSQVQILSHVNPRSGPILAVLIHSL